MLIALFASFAALLPAQAAPSPDAPLLKAAHDQAQACANATLKGDFEKLIDLTNPVVIEKMGGRETMITKVREATDQMKKDGITFVSTSVTNPDAVHRLDSDLYVIVPMTMVIKIKESKIKAKSYLLGHSSDEGKTWKFLDGSPGEPEIRKMLPKLPKDLRFPNKEKPQPVRDNAK